MPSTSPTHQTSGAIRLRFLFANHDGVAVELSVLPSTRVVDVKHRLREVWPPALLNAERKNISGSNTTSNMRTPNGILSHNHNDSNSDYQEEYWPESEDEDGVYEDEGEDDDDGTVASCSGAGLSASRWRAPEVDRLRLICMGQGLLKDSRTLQECHVPAFITHPTPVNVSIRPPPPRPPGKGKKGLQKKEKEKMLHDEEGGSERVGAVVPRGCVSCLIM